MKFLLFSDLHLDAPFTWDGPALSRRINQGRHASLRNIVKLADDADVDAVLCGGDLFEHRLASNETEDLLRRSFEDIAPVPVYISPGNHDWMGPESLYRRADWSPNVHVFDEPALQPLPIEDGITLWGSAHVTPKDTRGFLDGFVVSGGGVHVALFHGAEFEGMSRQKRGSDPNAPFRARQILASGLHHAFLGHYHEPRDAEAFTYPGNPDPLSFEEGGESDEIERGAVIAVVNSDGSVERSRVKVAVTGLHNVIVDVTTADTAADIRVRVVAALTGLTGVARVTLTGQVDADAAISASDLKDIETDLDGVQYRTLATGIS